MELSNFDIDERGVMLIPANVTKPNKLSENNKIGVREIKMHNQVVALPSQFAQNSRLLNYVAFPNNLETIPQEAFSGCVKLACVDLPTSLRTIEERAFKDSGVEYLSFGDDLLSIKEGGFLNCNLIKVDFSPHCKLSIIGKNAFAGNKRLKSITLPNSVVEIDEGAFAGCMNLKSFVVGPNVVKMGNPFKSELYIRKGRMSLNLLVHLNSATIVIPGLEPIKAKDFESLEMNTKSNMRIVYTTHDVFVESIDRIRGVSEFKHYSKLEFEQNEIENSTKQKEIEWLNESLLHDYLKQALHIDADKMEFDSADIQKLLFTKSQFVELSFTCTKLIEVSALKRFCQEHTDFLLEYLKAQEMRPNQDAVSVRTHQLNWQKLYETLSKEQKQVHSTAVDLLGFKQKIFMATFGDSFDNISKDKVSSEQLNFLVREGERQLESRWLEEAEDNNLESFTEELNEENNRLCKALTMQEYISKLNIDKESFYQLADILVQNPSQWDEYLESNEDSAVVGYVKSLQHEYDWQLCFSHLPRKFRDIYNHYEKDLLPAELRRSKTKFTKKDLVNYIKDGLFKFQTLILKTQEADRGAVMEKFVSNMEKAHTFGVLCRVEAEKQFKLQNKRPKDKDEEKKWLQDLAKAGEDAYYAKYNEVMQKVEHDKVDYHSILHVCKVNFKNKPVEKNLLPVSKLRGKISILKFKSMHISPEVLVEFL